RHLAVLEDVGDARPQLAVLQERRVVLEGVQGHVGLFLLVVVAGNTVLLKERDAVFRERRRLPVRGGRRRTHQRESATDGQTGEEEGKRAHENTPVGCGRRVQGGRVAQAGAGRRQADNHSRSTTTEQ